MSKFMLRRLGVAEDPQYQPPHLQACLEAVLEQSPLLMDDVLEGLQAALLPGPDNKPARVTDEQTRQTIESLVKQTQALRQDYAAHLRTYLFGGQSARQRAQQSMRFDDFQFLDSEQIDANIAFAHCLQAVQTAVEDVLPTLNAVVSRLLGWSSVQALLNPLKPASFVQALSETLEDLVPARAARASVMGLASGLLGVSLHKLFREVSEWLRVQGVEPVHMATNASSSLWNPEDAADHTIARTMLTLERLRRLLSGELDPNPDAQDVLDFSGTIPVSFEALQDMKLVEPMLKRLTERAAQSAPVPLDEAASADGSPQPSPQEPSQEQRRELGRRLAQEVVQLMLEHLVQDARLLAPVRASLKALEPVLVQLSQQDGRLLSDHHHPARVFLDRLTHRSLAFPSEQSPGYASFQAAFDAAVSKLLSGAGDGTAFARALRALDDQWSNDEAGQNGRAALAARGLLHAEQRNLLAHRLGQQFDERMQDKKVPELVAAFLRGPWAHVVAQAQLDVADGSVDPGGYQALVDDLIWSVQRRLTRRNRPRLLQLVPDMLPRMRRGLALISYPPQRTEAFFEALIAFHEQVLGSSRAAVAAPEPRKKPAQEAVDPTLAAATVGAAAFWMGEKEAADSGYLDDDAAEVVAEPPQAPQEPANGQPPWSVDSLDIGSWVDLALAGNWVRAQLTWASPQRTLFMFISGKGMAHSMSRKTVERMKKSRLIRMVSDTRVVDNALDAVARAALRNDLLASQLKAGD